MKKHVTILAYALKKLKEQQKKDKNKHQEQKQTGRSQPQMSKEQAERIECPKNMEQKLQGKRKRRRT